jgi:hypothetical protein
MKETKHHTRKAIPLGATEDFELSTPSDKVINFLNLIFGGAALRQNHQCVYALSIV